MNKWDEIAFPALLTIRELQAESSYGRIDCGTDIADKLNRTMSEVGPQLRALRDDGYIIIGQEAPSGGDPFGLFAIRLAPRGLRILGDGPSEDVEELMEALTNALESARTPDDRGKLKELMVRIAESAATRGASEVVENLIKIVM